MRKHILRVVCLLFILIFSVTGITKEIRKLELKPIKKITLQNNNILTEKIYFFINPYKNLFIYTNWRKVFVFNQNSKLIKKIISQNPQEPGGFNWVINIFPEKDFMLFITINKVIKFNNEFKFINEKTRNYARGRSLKWISEDEKKLIFYTDLQGFVRIENGKEVARNLDLRLPNVWHDTSIMQFFRNYLCSLDKKSNKFYAIECGSYTIYVLDPKTLKVLKRKKIKHKEFKMADTKKQGVYKMMSVTEYRKLVYGICEVQNIAVDDKYLFVRWGERIGHQSFVDIFDKNSLKLLISFKLEKTHKETNRYAAFDALNGLLYEDDYIEFEDFTKEKRIIKIYNIKNAIYDFYKNSI